jgi:serine/threonine protein kinase
MDGATDVAAIRAGPRALGRLEGLLVADTYRVSGRLGSGGMGEVHEAEHIRLGSPVAIKFLRASALIEPRSAEMFRREARRAAAICNEHVVRVFDYGHLADGTPYLVMERLFGEDLRHVLARDGALPIRRAVNLILGACRGAYAAHGIGLVHRDLKPANLFVERKSDGTEICKVLDFGVAKALESETTKPGTMIGTVRYMAPEQLENAAAATASADMYALGAILYEALTGLPAHAGESLEKMMFDIVHRDVKRPSLHRPLPAALEAAILRALARDPTKRFGNIKDFMVALTPFGSIEGNTLDAGGNEVTQFEQFRPPSPAMKLSFGVMLPACLVIGALIGWLARGVRQEPGRTATDARESQVTVKPAAPAPIPIQVQRTETVGRVPESQPAVSAMPLALETRRVISSVQGRTPVRTQQAPHGVVLERPTSPVARSPSMDARFDPTDPYE